MMPVQENVDTEKLEAKAGAVFDVLSTYEVFGGISGERLEREKTRFKTVVALHSIGTYGEEPLRPSVPLGVRINIETEVVGNEARFVSVFVEHYPTKTNFIEVEPLNVALEAVLAG